MAKMIKDPQAHQRKTAALRASQGGFKRIARFIGEISRDMISIRDRTLNSIKTGTQLAGVMTNNNAAGMFEQKRLILEL